MYRIEIKHEGHWLVGRDSGIDDLDGEFGTIIEARRAIRACADTETMEGRTIPEARIVSTVTIAARILGRRGGLAHTEAKIAASRINGRKGGRPRA